MDIESISVASMSCGVFLFCKSVFHKSFWMRDRAVGHISVIGFDAKRLFGLLLEGSGS